MRKLPNLIIELYLCHLFWIMINKGPSVLTGRNAQYSELLLLEKEREREREREREILCCSDKKAGPGTHP